jgi:hypothetical protein
MLLTILIIMTRFTARFSSERREPTATSCGSEEIVRLGQRVRMQTRPGRGKFGKVHRPSVTYDRSQAERRRYGRSELRKPIPLERARQHFALGE